jgi:hypothetical protein
MGKFMMKALSFVLFWMTLILSCCSKGPEIIPAGDITGLWKSRDLPAQIGEQPI